MPGVAVPALMRRDSSTANRITLLWAASVVMLVLWEVRDLVVLVCFAVLLAYGLAPAVNALTRLRFAHGRAIPRWAAAAVVISLLVGLVVWAVTFSLPRLAREAGRFAATTPETLAGLVSNAQLYGEAHGWSVWSDPMIEQGRSALATVIQDLGGILFRWAGHFFGGVGRWVGFTLLPLLSFYILAEAGAVEASVNRLLPAAARPGFHQVGTAVDLALRAYVRGQALVSVMMGVLVAGALALCGGPAPLLLGLVVALAELVPYVGFTIAALSIVVAGASVGPGTAWSGFVSYAVINWTVGTFISPRVMGRYLRMHPFVATLSVLAGAGLLGPAGAVLALPAVAVLQSLVARVGPLVVRPSSVVQGSTDEASPRS